MKWLLTDGNMIKRWLYFIKLRYYFWIVKHELWSCCLEGKAIPENYLWIRLDYYLNLFKNNGGQNAGEEKPDNTGR